MSESADSNVPACYAGVQLDSTSSYGTESTPSSTVTYDTDRTAGRVWDKTVPGRLSDKPPKGQEEPSGSVMSSPSGELEKEKTLSLQQRANLIMTSKRPRDDKVSG